MFEFAEAQHYQLVDVRDLFGRSKAHMSDLYSTRVGCTTSYIRMRPYSADVDGLCLYVHFSQDADGNFVNRHLHTSIISEIIEGEEIEVITANSIYVFKPAEPKEPEFREATNLIELWLGTGDYLFDKGVHYDAFGVPHILTNSIHLGTVRDSCLICHQDTMSATVCRYFPGQTSAEFYDTIYGQQDYDMPMWIHNTANHPLTVKFQFHRDVRHEIEPGGELLIHPPKRNKRRRV